MNLLFDTILPFRQKRTLVIKKQPPEMYYIAKSVLEFFPKFTRKHLCQSLFVTKITVLRPEILLKKRLWQKCFHMNFANILKALFYRTPPDDCLCNEELSLHGELQFNMDDIQISSIYW